jgi:hypothetical protein
MGNWNDFWKNYRNDFIPENEKDLLIQVGKTINKNPISNDEIDLIVNDIVDKLNLLKNDSLLEMCCGNGIITKKLSNQIQKIYAFDFTDHLVNCALKFNNANNIEYSIGDANKNFFNFFNEKKTIEKFLMSFSLGYFNVLELEQILIRIMKHSKKFSFYITEVPIDELKWNFYNTEERKKFYNNTSKDEFNNGMGKWWKKNELIEIAKKYDLIINFFEISNISSNYRLNVLFSS